MLATTRDDRRLNDRDRIGGRKRLLEAAVERAFLLASLLAPGSRVRGPA
jgi:hypothetical protein